MDVSETLQTKRAHDGIVKVLKKKKKKQTTKKVHTNLSLRIEGEILPLVNNN